MKSRPQINNTRQPTGDGNHAAHPDYSTEPKTIEGLKELVDKTMQELNAERERNAELSCQISALNEHAVVSITDTRGKIIYANDKFCQLSGYSREELIGQTHGLLRSGEHSKQFYGDLWKTIASGKPWSGTIKNKAKDGSFYWLQATIAPSVDSKGKISNYVAIRADITDQVKRKARLQQLNLNLEESLESEKVARTRLNSAMDLLERMATTDELTGLPNRTFFTDRLDETVNDSIQNGTKFAVLFFDFDRFKRINDSLGHPVGDALLLSISDIFLSQLRDTDIVARFGGDEFVVLLNDLSSWDDALNTANSLRNSFAAPHNICNHNVISTASIGLFTNQFGTSTPDEIIRNADTAMYHSKSHGRNRVVEFDQQMHEDAIDRLTIEEDLQSAVRLNQLRLHYQPLIELSDGGLKGFEALIRWEHPTRGFVSPGDFIPIAEDSELIIEIGNWVLENTAKQISLWDKMFGDKIKISINANVSKRQLLQPDFIESLKECTKKYNINPSQLPLEITESVIVDGRSDIIPLLYKIRSLGFPIAMDDFGTGVSSLSTLHSYPLDVLKIDQSFINALDGDRSLLAVVSAITSLAENLDISTVAEGIESTEVIGALQSINCHVGQGYYFAKPLPTKQAEEYIHEHLRGRSQAA